jgi:hypothetical protein
MNSLFISIELHSPHRNYLGVEKAVNALGTGIRVHTYLWYVACDLSAAEASAKLWGIMDERDSVLVVDATRHEAGWKHLPQDVSEFIRTRVQQPVSLASKRRTSDTSTLQPYPRERAPVAYLTTPRNVRESSARHAGGYAVMLTTGDGDPHAA